MTKVGCIPAVLLAITCSQFANADTTSDAATAAIEAARVATDAAAQATDAAAQATAAAKAANDAAQAVLVAAGKSTSAPSTPTADVPKYVVQDGKVDKATYNGYRRYHGTCHACHGQDALGGSFAPALAESLKTIDYRTFISTVKEGRQTTGSDGTVSAMPAFAKDPNITKHLDDIYRYLTARADGALSPGRPAKLPKKKN